jgi:LacI family transcriptional regulator
MPQAAHVMLIVETSLAYGREVLRGISDYVVEHGPWSMYLDLRELIIDPPRWIDSWDGDGIISRSTTPELAERLRASEIPTVDLTDIHGDLGLPHIWTDNFEVGRLAATHLLERGFKHFGYCSFSGHDWAKKRLHGFRDTLAKSGIGTEIFESPWAGTHSWEDQQQAIAEWISGLPRPLGIFACNDMRGQHVLDACRRLDIPVPEEVAVIGVDDDELVCGMCAPPLSSVKPNPRRIGYEAASMLDRLMRGEAALPYEQIVPPLKVSTRQSTDVLAIEDPQIASAVKFIRQNACRGITVRDVLRQVPLSRNVLERRFRKYVKRSPQSEIRSVQIKRIKQLLMETDLPLDRIALLTGFEHPEYMSVVFKRETGTPPGSFRKQSQTRQEGGPAPA